MLELLGVERERGAVRDGDARAGDRPAERSSDRSSGAQGWEDRSYGGGSDAFGAGRTRRRRSSGGGEEG